jgi:hypothetical protein
MREASSEPRPYEDEAIFKSGNTSSGFSNPLSMSFGGSFSFSSSFIHSGVGIND